MIDLTTISEELERITNTLNEWSNQTIEININLSEAENNPEFQKYKNLYEKYVEGINQRMAGLRAKIINQLHEHYEKATEHLQPYQTLADIFMNVGSSITSVVSALKKAGEYFLSIYNKYLAIVTEITQEVVQLATLITNFVTKIPNPPRIVFKDGEWSPTKPTMESISLDDIISGTDTNT